MERIILHIDVNSAFLSWSAIKLLREGYPKDIRNEVAVIAGDPSKRHGVIVAASVPAKKLGIKAPTNLYEARKIYRDLIVVKPEHKFYKYCSNLLINYLKSLFDKVEQFSIDECFIDYTEMKKIYGDEVKYATFLKDSIYKKFGFTVNIGIGNNKLCAKMASDFEKPNKVHTLYLNEFQKKVWDKDISELFMAGKSSCEKLRKLGINTIKDLATFDENILISKLKSHGKLLHEYANGIDNSPINIDSYDEVKSIGYSKTLEFSTDDKNIIYDNLKRFSRDIEIKLKKRKLYANVITVTIRDDYFKTVNHQEKLLNSIYKYEDIYERGKMLFNKLWDDEKIRLIGLSVSDLASENNYQLSLFENSKQINNKTTDDLIDKLNNTLGENVIFKGNKLERNDKNENSISLK